MISTNHHIELISYIIFTIDFKLKQLDLVLFYTVFRCHFINVISNVTVFDDCSVGQLFFFGFLFSGLSVGVVVEVVKQIVEENGVG